MRQYTFENRTKTFENRRKTYENRKKFPKYRGVYHLSLNLFELIKLSITNKYDTDMTTRIFRVESKNTSIKFQILLS